MRGSVAATGVRLDITELALDPLPLFTALRHVGEVAFARGLRLVVPCAQGLKVLEGVVVPTLDVIHVSPHVLAATTRGPSATASTVTLEHLLAATLPVRRKTLLSI